MKELRVQSDWIDVSDLKPPVGHSVDYKTPTHQGLGYLDPTGRWMSFEGRLEPDFVIAWHEHRARTPAARLIRS